MADSDSQPQQDSTPFNPVPSPSVQEKTEFSQPHYPPELGRLIDIAAFTHATSPTSPGQITEPALCVVGNDADIHHLPQGPTGALSRTVGQVRTRSHSVSAPENGSISREEAQELLSAGMRISDELIDEGVDLIIPVCLSKREKLRAIAAISVCTRTEPIAAVGFNGIDDATWLEQIPQIRDLMYPIRSSADQPLELLQGLGAAELIVACGIIAQAAVRRTPVLLDSLAESVAAYFADRLAPGTRQWLIAGLLVPTPAHLLALRQLGLTPLFAMNLPLGHGAGALMTLPLLRCADEMIQGYTGRR